MLDWLAVWGATQAVGLIVKPILEELVKEAGKDWAKDFLKGFPSKILDKLKKEDIEIAAAKALKEFLQLMQQDLEDSGLAEDEIKKYKQPIKHYLKNQAVKQHLGNAFKDEAQSVDVDQLAALWTKLNPTMPLPDDFNWKRLGKKYIQKVKDIIREFPELREVIDSKDIEQIKEYTKERAGIIPEFDLQYYQEGIRERYGNLKLESLDTSGYAYNELKLWQMFIAQNVREVHQVLPQVHELPKEHLKRLRESDQLEAELQAGELESHKRVYLEQPIRLVLDVVNDQQNYKYIVILGDPGSGKSTLLQFLALNWAISPLDNVISQPIPLLIELRTYMRRREDQECHNFLEFFHKCSGAISHLNQHQLHEELKAGNAVVMFDGLDEVFDPGKREDVITDIHRFTNDYPDVRVIVTSRVIGYKPQRLRDAEFSHFMLQDLESEQIQDFIRRWHDLTFKDEADRVIKRERLQRAIETSKAIAELAGNPLLLTMMAILNRNQELPRDRETLYEQASRVLLHQWDVERALVEDPRLDPKTIDYKDKQAILRQVAYFMQTSDKGLAGNVIHADDLEKILTDYLKSIEVSSAREAARVMINQLRTRNFILCFLGADYYAFVHRTFLEYFCAWEFVKRFEKRGVENGLSVEALKTDVFGKHWRDETWHEVLLLIAGMIEAEFVGEIINYLMSLDGEEEKFINLFLAAKCIAEVRNPGVIEQTGNTLLAKIKKLTKYDLWYYYEPYQEKENQLVREIRTQAVVAIATTWTKFPNTLSWLKDRATQDNNWAVRQAAVQELARAYKDDPDTLSWLKDRATQDDNCTVRQAAVQELARGFKDDPDTIFILKDRATQDKDNDVRSAAVQELACGYKDHPDTFSWLKERATQDKDNYVRRAAVQELACGYKDHPDTFSWLKERATQDKDNYVRRAAVQELAHGFKDDPDTLSILKDRITQDDNWYVRFTAVNELARAYKDHPDTFSILKDRAIQDDIRVVQCVAVQELARSYKDYTDILSWLKDLATQDNDWNVRQVAVQELARGFKDDPDTISILIDCTAKDDSKVVRSAAVQELARAYKDHPDTFFWLKDRATQDDNWDVRQAAVKELARAYKDDPQTIFILQDRTTQDDNWDVRRAAVKELARAYKNDPQTIFILQDRATQDDNWDVRRAAVQELARGFKDHPELFDICYNCAVNDPFERQYDVETNPRRVALEIIIKQCPQNPQTLPLLHDRAENDPDEKVREYAQKQLKQWEG